MRLFHLEVGNAVAQQATDAIIFLKHRHIVTSPCQLLRSGQARRAGTDDRHFFARFVLGQLGRDPALGPGPVNDGVFN